MEEGMAGDWIAANSCIEGERWEEAIESRQERRRLDQIRLLKIE
jgi:hypothetical protein